MYEIKKHKVKEIEMTCGACPSQWEGRTQEDEYVYIRYRWGYLYAQVERKLVFELEHGDSFGGVMSTNEMMELTESVLDWSDVSFA